MGSPPDEADRLGDETPHTVTLTRDYEIQSTEVTQTQFEELMGYRRGAFPCTDCPVEDVSWDEAAAYCNALSDKARLESCYSCDGSGSERLLVCDLSDEYTSPYECPGYRLPTEAEWENAARAGTTGPRYGDLMDIAWFVENSDEKTHPVGLKEPNHWGLYDMLGNVLEWCHDLHGDYPTGPTEDPFGLAAGTTRIRRSTSWARTSDTVRVARRAYARPEHHHNQTGLRPVRSLP